MARGRFLPFVHLLLPLLLAAQEAPPVREFVPHAQATAAVVPDTPVTAAQRQPGTVTVVADPRIEELMHSYTLHKQVQQGYRVQIFLGDRKTAEETKRTFLLKYPDTPAYLSWLAPNFRLRVGDLRTRLEAERLLSELKPLHPGAYIVPDEIEMPMLPPSH